MSSRALTGAITNNDVPMDVGARCGEFYHTGLIDEVIYIYIYIFNDILLLKKDE